MNMLQVLLHDPADHPQMSDQGFVVAPGTHTLVTILQKQVDWGYIFFAIGSSFISNIKYQSLELLSFSNYCGGCSHQKL